MHSQGKQDYDSSTPVCGEVDEFFQAHAGYAPEGNSQSIVDISQNPGLFELFSQQNGGASVGFTPDTSALYQSTPNFPPFDGRQRLPSQSVIATNPLANYRGPVVTHPPVRHMSTREKYSAATPKFGRQAEAARARSPAFHDTVMRRNSWRGGVPPLPSTYQPSSDSREHSRSPTYSSRATDDVALPMEPTECLGTLQYLDANASHPGSQPTPIEPSISAIIHKNFFMGEKYYTCYRRNYMACNCSFSLSPYIPGVQTQFTPLGSTGPMQVMGYAMCLSAVVSAHQHQEVTILQHTPKRDKGPISQPQRQLMAPKVSKGNVSPPHIGSYADGHSQGQRSLFGDGFGVGGCQSLPTEHNFDRIQFKTATANNGERRAGQQCYRLVVELWANVGTQAAEPWVKVAIQKSTEIVVRGRSPGHYQKERRKSQGSGGGPSPHGNYGGNGGMGDYGNGGLPGGQANGYGNPGPYDGRGGLYGGGGLRPQEFTRRDMPYTAEKDSTRMFPSAYMSPNPYAEAGLYHQAAQTAGVSPADLYGKQRSDPDMGASLPRSADVQPRTGLDQRYSNTTTLDDGAYPLPPMGTASYVSST